MASAAQQIAVAGKKLFEMERADFLLTFEENLDSHRRAALETPDRSGVDNDPGLVVGGSPAEQATVRFDRIEGRCVPELRRAGRLDVVVGIQEDRRNPLARRRDLSVNRRMGIFDLEKPYPVQSGCFQLVSAGNGALADSGRIESRRANRVNPDQLLQVGPHRRSQLIYRSGQIVESTVFMDFREAHSIPSGGRSSGALLELGRPYMASRLPSLGSWPIRRGAPCRAFFANHGGWIPGRSDLSDVDGGRAD